MEIRSTTNRATASQEILRRSDDTRDLFPFKTRADSEPSQSVRIPVFHSNLMQNRLQGLTLLWQREKYHSNRLGKIITTRETLFDSQHKKSGGKRIGHRRIGCDDTHG